MGLSMSRRPVVLIVEDEFLLRMDAVDMIAAAGFEVVEAADADEAIGILEARRDITVVRSEEHTSELQSHLNLVCRLLLEKKKKSTGEEGQTRMLSRLSFCIR